MISTEARRTLGGVDSAGFNLPSGFPVRTHFEGAHFPCFGTPNARLRGDFKRGFALASLETSVACLCRAVCAGLNVPILIGAVFSRVHPFFKVLASHLETSSARLRSSSNVALRSAVDPWNISCTRLLNVVVLPIVVKSHLPSVRVLVSVSPVFF